jgi:hypothetical protein
VTSAPAETANRPQAPAIAPVTMATALNRALADALAADDRVVVFGEDVGTLGGVFRITDGLATRFGEDRVFDTPLAEAGIVGTAIGMAMNGLRPVVEMQFDEPWVAGGQLAIRKLCQLTLAFDHRICDGATAGRFLRLVADCVEAPVSVLGDL